MANGNPRRTVPARLCTPIDAAAVAQALALVHDFTAGLPPTPAARLAIIVEELVANLVEHAGLPPGAMLELELARAGGRILVMLTDPAAPFDPRGHAPGAIPDRGGSAGLALVRAFATIEGYDRIDGRNRLLLSLPTA